MGLYNLHSVPGSGSRVFSYPSAASGGYSQPGNVRVNAYAERLTGAPVFLINPEDVTSLSGPIRTQQVTVGTTATALPSGTDLDRRRALMIYNNGGEVVYISAEEGTSVLNSFPIPTGQSFVADLMGHHKIWARTNSSTSDVRVMEIKG